MKKSRLLAAALSIALAVLFLTGCPGNGSNPPGDNSNQDNNPPSEQNTGPAALSQQTRVVLAEMFTGDW